MKVRLFAYMLVFCVGFAVAAPYVSRAEGFDGGELIRLHIVANSDEEGDQTVKLAVRDAIRAQVKEIVDDARSADDAFLAMERARGAIEETAAEVLRQHGYAYGARVELGTFEFPDREYDGTLVPAGPYRAVRIVLGSGEGHNWWCVLYPDLCFVDEACRNRVADGEPVRFYSSIGRWIHNLLSRGEES